MFVQNNLKNVIDRFEAFELDALLLVNDSNIRYVSGYTGSDSYILLLKDCRYFITDYRYREQAEQECENYEIIEVNRETERHERVMATIAADHRLKKIGFETNHVIHKFLTDFQKELADITLVATEGLVEELRSIKAPAEIEAIGKAAAIADLSFTEFLGSLQPGISEMDLAWELETILRKNGSQGSAFPIILVSGQNASLPHGIPSRKKTEPGDFITMDFGALYNGYRSDMTRTVVLGKADDKQLKIYEIVKEAQAKGVTTAKAGLSGQMVNQTVNDIIGGYNYLEFSGRGLGHGLGLDIHEIPFLNARCETILRDKMVVTIEPGIYIPHWGGVRIEDTVVVTDDGCYPLTKSPKHLISL